jgi:hypothetical protein
MAGIFSGAGIANDTSVSNSDKKAYSKLAETELSNSSLISTVQNLIAKTISKTLVDNTSNIKSIIDLNNSISISANPLCAGSMEGGFELKNIDQIITISSTNVNIQQSTIVANITSKVNNDISDSVSIITSDTAKMTNVQKIGSTLGGIADSAIGVVTNFVGDVGKVFGGAGACAGVANSCSQSKSTETNIDLQTKYKLDNKFDLSKKTYTSNIASSELKTTDITDILKELLGNNELLVADVCPSAISITDIEQTINVTSMMTNSVLLKLATTVASNYITKIQSVIDNMSSHAITTENNKNKGDIATFGDAVACVINAGGKAASGVIVSTGNAAGQVIDTTSDSTGNLISSAGNSVKNLFSGFTGPLIIFLVVGVLVYFLFIKKKAPGKKSRLKAAARVAPVAVEPVAEPVVVEPVVESSDDSEPIQLTNTIENKDSKYKSVQLGGFHGILHKISEAINNNRH